jgi:hypothetical protein
VWLWLVVVLVPVASAGLAEASPARVAKACATSGLRPKGVTQSITVRGASCARARTVVHEWYDRLKTDDRCIWADGSYKPGICTVKVWHCSSYHTVNGQTYPVTCKSDAGRREVHFVNQV